MDEMRRELLELIRKLSYRRRKVVLSSGRESDFYVDGKNTTLHPRGAYLGGRLLWKAIRDSGAVVEAVGGPTMGADPMVTAIAIASLEDKSPVPAFIIRKEAKKHGTGQWIEGGENLRPGMKVAIVEDVVTTGASTLRAVERAEQEGLVVSLVLVLVDREEGGRENIEEKGYRLVSLFGRREIAGEDQ